MNQYMKQSMKQSIKQFMNHKSIIFTTVLLASSFILYGCTTSNLNSGNKPETNQEGNTFDSQNGNTSGSQNGNASDPDGGNNSGSQDGTQGGGQDSSNANGESGSPDTDPNNPYSTGKLDNVISEHNEATDDFYGDYMEQGGKIAYVTGVSQINDSDYNTAVYDGVKRYAEGAGITYSYYIAEQDTEDSYRQTIMSAVSNNAELIITSGSHYDVLVGELQDEYPDLSFLMVDGQPLDEDGNKLDIEKNVHCISFKEQEAGYLAGYMAVMDGYTKLGFIGGEEIPPVIRYGYGYLQGINDASIEKNNTKSIEVSYWYSGTFLPSDVVFNTASDWYENNDTEVIFCCGGSLYESVLAAADIYDCKLIGVDINQNKLSDRIITSAMKGVDRAVVNALDDFYASNGWSADFAGKMLTYGIEERCSSLPVEPWRFSNLTTKDYDTLYRRVKNGDIDINSDISKFPELKITVQTYISNEE